jgi:tetratricopeptide (TPR) repeat protein
MRSSGLSRRKTEAGTLLFVFVRARFFTSQFLIPNLLLILLACLSTARAVQVSLDRSAQLEDCLRRAQEAQRSGDYRSAAASYCEFLKLQPDAAEVRANLGLMQHLLGEYSEAIKTLEEALRQKPRLFVPNLFLGLDLLRLRQAQKALPYLQRAQQLNPADEQAAVGLGQAFVALLKYQEANEWYFRATEINPVSNEAWFGLGLTYFNLEQQAVEKLKEWGPNSAYSQMLLAESFELQGRTPDAIKLYHRLFLSHRSTPPCAHAALGFAYIQQSEIDAAEKEFRKELESKTGCPLALLGLSRVSIERGETENSLEDLDEAWKADHNSVEANAAYLLKGLQLEKVNELEDRAKQSTAGPPGGGPELARFVLDAIQKWRQNPETIDWGPQSSNNSSVGKGGSLRPSFSDRAPLMPNPVGELYSECRQRMKAGPSQQATSSAQLLVARCAFYSGDYRMSFQSSGEVLKGKPRNPEGWYWRAETAGRLAVNALLRAGSAEPNSPRVHVLLGDAYREKKRYEEARVEYGIAIQLDPKSFPAHLGLAIASFNEFKFQQALPELQKALEILPEDPEANFITGHILVNQHQYEEALPYLKVALRNKPANLPNVHALIGKIYAAEGRTADAVAELKQSLEADEDGSYHYQLYELYRKLGDQKSAAAALEKSEVLRAKNRLARQRLLLDPSP